MFFNNASVFCQYANLEFVENKGQWDQKIKFKGLLNNGAFFLQEKGFKVVLSRDEDLDKLSASFHAQQGSKKETLHKRTSPASKIFTPAQVATDDPIIVHSHAYDVEFINAATPTITPDKPLDTYSNYFIGNDPSVWKSNVKTFQAVTYNNLYHGVDVRYYTNNGKLKYDVIVNPSADVSSIAMKYDGVEDLQVKNEQLIIKTSIGETRELAPYAYQVINGVKKRSVVPF